MRQNQIDPKIESIVKDFMDRDIAKFLSEAHSILSKSVGVFFLISYCAASTDNSRYSSLMEKYFEKKDVEKFNGFKVINNLLKSDDYELLYESSTFAHLSKMFQLPHGSKEEKSLIEQVRQVAIPHYLTMIKNLDSGERYFSAIKKKGYIAPGNSGAHM